MNTPHQGKGHLLLAGFFFVVITVMLFLFLRSELRPRSSITNTNSAAETKNDRTEVQGSSPSKSTQGGAQNSPLESAKQCAAYIQEVYDSVPAHRGTTRHQLLAVKGMLFVSDYVMAAKKGSLPLSKQGIASAFADVSPSTLPVTSYLETYSSSDRSLSEHYALLRRNESAGKQVAGVEAMLKKSGVAVEPEGDMLLDCIRLAALLTEVREVYGPREDLLDQSIPIPEEEAACANALKKVFRYRLEHRYGLAPLKAEEVVALLASNKLSGLSPAEFEVPARLQ